MECVPPSSSPPRKWGLVWIPALFVGFAPLSFQVLAVTPVGNYFPSSFVPLLHALSLVLAILTAFSILLSLCTLLCVLISRNTSKVFSRCLLSVTLVVSIQIGFIGSTEIHLRALERLSKTGMDVVSAVTEFERRFGCLPESIDDLVPSVLAEIPKTGFPAYPNFEFVRLPIYGSDMKGNPWMLTVHYTGMFIFPQFIYLPKRNYNEIEITGFMVGDWFYVDDEIRWPEGGRSAPKKPLEKGV